jgi:(4S)-4-hydroxy-5-phosphonooxypentane-2,3-dione isomerase
MQGYVLVVEFHLKPGTHGDFRALVDANARASSGEPGCRRFDVLEPEGERDRILLYEIYDDRAAFDAHVASDHYAAFAAASASLVAGKLASTHALVFEASEE